MTKKYWMCVKKDDKGKGEKDLTNLTNHMEEICANGRFHSEVENMFGSFSRSQHSSIKKNGSQDSSMKKHRKLP